MRDQETIEFMSRAVVSATGEFEALEELDYEDVPWDRVPKLKEFMYGDDAYASIRCANVLTSWCDEEAFNFLEHYVCDKDLSNQIVFPHRARGYDDTCTQILHALVSYWARKASPSWSKNPEEEGALARKKLLRPALRIIGLSSHMQFDIAGFFWLIEKMGFTEYIPALKAHLEAILKNPEFHHWKVGDCAHLLMKFDPDFVTQALAKHGKTLADYPNK